MSTPKPSEKKGLLIPPSLRKVCEDWAALYKVVLNFGLHSGYEWAMFDRLPHSDFVFSVAGDRDMRMIDLSMIEAKHIPRTGKPSRDACIKAYNKQLDENGGRLMAVGQTTCKTDAEVTETLSQWYASLWTRLSDESTAEQPVKREARKPRRMPRTAHDSMEDAVIGEAVNSKTQ